MSPHLPPNALRLARIYVDGTPMPRIAEQEGVAYSTVTSQVKRVRRILTAHGYDVGNAVRLRKVLIHLYGPIPYRGHYIDWEHA